MPSRLPFLRGLAVMLMAGILLGIPPPSAGSPPETEIRTVSLDPGALLPAGDRGALRADGSIRPRKPVWTTPRTVCSPIRFTAVGLTWDQTGDAPVVVRLRWGSRPGALGKHTRVVADPEEGPDPGSPDDSGIDGTPPVWTGDAKCLKVRLRLPDSARFAEPKAVFLNSSGTATDRGPLAAMGSALLGAWRAVASPWAPRPAAAITKQPPIRSRAQWGADESLPRCEPGVAPKLKMAYVHHTASSNGYSRGQTDDVLRAIYAYHVKSRGFCDIAYNFLIDRFGRIWEGRRGGINRPIIGGHAMGFNTGSAGISAIGDFSSKAPPKPMIRAFKRLLAWRLDVAHLKPRGTAIMVSAGGSNQKFKKGESVKLKVISGHKDTGYTSCPGRLYDKLRQMRRAAQKLGMPKIWNPSRSSQRITPGEGSITYKAVLSGDISWTVTVESRTTGDMVRTFTGRGRRVRVVWDGRDKQGTPVAEGPYRALINAAKDNGAVARQARLQTVVDPAVP